MARTRLGFEKFRNWKAITIGVLGTLATGCGFSSPAASRCGPTNSPNWIACMLEQAPFRDIDSDARETVYEAPGLIRVRHGRSCVQAPRADGNGTVGFRIRDKESVPFSIADSGTVFMNGWELHYKNGDHHVQGLGSTIVNVTSSRTQDEFVLNWEAGGVLTDENGDDPYEWCYTYTVAFWSRRGSAFDAVVSSTGGAFMHYTPSDPGNESALRDLSGSAPHPYGPGVVLPQGFAMVLGDTDHHLLQVGLDYGQHSSLQAGKIEWNSRTLLKDNDKRRDYFAGALVSVLSYSSPQSWHPESVQRETVKGWENVTNRVALTPLSSESFCGAVGSGQYREHYMIPNVPFEYAVPVLKGWELGYLCTDHHVRDMGISISDWRYERATNATSGTLYYTLDMELTDSDNNYSYGRASVDVWGMNARGLEPHPLYSGAALEQLASPAAPLASH